MALPQSSADRDIPQLLAGVGTAKHDRRALQILAKTIYRELRQSGLVEEDVMCVAGELLSHVAADVKDRRRG